ERSSCTSHTHQHTADDPTAREEVLIALLVGNDQGKILDLLPRTREIPQDSSPAPPPRKGVSCDLRGPSKTELVLPPEPLALYATRKAVDGALVSVQP